MADSTVARKPRSWQDYLAGEPAARLHDTSQGVQASPLAAAWNGRSWRLLKTAHTGRGSGVTDLASISCPSAHRCIAVSGYGDAEPTVSAAVEAWDGRRWRLRAASVRCPRPGRCMAVGFYGTPFVRHTLAERWDGTTWRRLTTPAA